MWEKNTRFGGQLQLALAVPGRKEFVRLIHFYENEIERLGVTVHSDCEATVDSIKQEAPDAVIIAAGVSSKYPDIPGVENPNVMTAHDVLGGKEISGEKAVIIGGGYTGCETAKYLVEKGFTVTVLRRGPRIGVEAGWSIRRLLLEEMRELGIGLMPNVEYKDFSPDGVNIVQDGEEKRLPADIVVLATGVTPNDSLYHALQGTIGEVYNVGDSKEPGDVHDAIEGARMVALKI